jgi:Tfp pilus assembly protein PilV
MHVNHSCLAFVNPTLTTPFTSEGFTMNKILIAVLSLAIGATAFAQSGAPAPAAQTATASPEAASAAVAKHAAKKKAKKAHKAAKAASAASAM